MEAACCAGGVMPARESAAPTRKGKVKIWSAPARRLEQGQLNAKSRLERRGESRGGQMSPMQSQLPPLALVRSCFSTTSAVNACIDGAKPLAALVADKGRYASFSGLRKKNHHNRQQTKGKSTNTTKRTGSFRSRFLYFLTPPSPSPAPELPSTGGT